MKTAAVALNLQLVLGLWTRPVHQNQPHPKRGEQITPNAKADTLTKREQEILRMIGRGLSRQEIADAICRSPKTVDGHRERIMAKLDIHTGPELVRFAIREGLAEA